MTGSSLVAIAGPPSHHKVYPTYENAGGYKINPGKNDDTLAWEWKVTSCSRLAEDTTFEIVFQVNGIYPSHPPPQSDLMWDVSSWTKKSYPPLALDVDPTMRVLPVY